MQDEQLGWKDLNMKVLDDEECRNFIAVGLIARITAIL
jgi:hypothetical protein